MSTGEMVKVVDTFFVYTNSFEEALEKIGFTNGKRSSETLFKGEVATVFNKGYIDEFLEEPSEENLYIYAIRTNDKREYLVGRDAVTRVTVGGLPKFHIGETLYFLANKKIEKFTVKHSFVESGEGYTKVKYNNSSFFVEEEDLFRSKEELVKSLLNE